MCWAGAGRSLREENHAAGQLGRGGTWKGREFNSEGVGFEVAEKAKFSYLELSWRCRSERLNRRPRFGPTVTEVSGGDELVSGGGLVGRRKWSRPELQRASRLSWEEGGSRKSRPKSNGRPTDEGIREKGCPLEVVCQYPVFHYILFLN